VLHAVTLTSKRAVSKAPDVHAPFRNGRSTQGRSQRVPTVAAIVRYRNRITRGILTVMAIPHAVPGQAVDVKPFGARLANEQTVALFKSEDLEVMRLVLRAGKSLPPHKVPGEITVQCIEGALDVTVDGESHVLRAGQLLYLMGAVLHGVTALEDSSALVTVALRT
jgi:quercetin dioxygenase-like cupin family protein